MGLRNIPLRFQMPVWTAEGGTGLHSTRRGRVWEALGHVEPISGSKPSSSHPAEILRPVPASPAVIPVWHNGNWKPLFPRAALLGCVVQGDAGIWGFPTLNLLHVALVPSPCPVSSSNKPPGAQLVSCSSVSLC